MRSANLIGAPSGAASVPSPSRAMQAAGLAGGFDFRTLAQRWLFPLCRARARRLGRKPHTAATRASRRGAGIWYAYRVDRVDFFPGGKIGTIDPFQTDQPLSVALSERYENAVFP